MGHMHTLRQSVKLQIRLASQSKENPRSIFDIAGPLRLPNYQGRNYWFGTSVGRSICSWSGTLANRDHLRKDHTVVRRQPTPMSKCLFIAINIYICVDTRSFIVHHMHLKPPSQSRNQNGCDISDCTCPFPFAMRGIESDG